MDLVTIVPNAPLLQYVRFEFPEELYDPSQYDIHPLVTRTSRSEEVAQSECIFADGVGVTCRRSMMLDQSVQFVESEPPVSLKRIAKSRPFVINWNLSRSSPIWRPTQSVSGNGSFAPRNAKLPSAVSILVEFRSIFLRCFATNASPPSESDNAYFVVVGK